ncbi:MAG: sodium:solute symporter family transporter [Adlercreutzia equolifaciens]
MSSSSSYLLISGSAVATNIFKGLIKRDATDNQVMIVARITLTVILLLGIFLAMDQSSSIFDIVSYAWAGFGASFGPLMLCSLYWRRTTLPGAVAGMLTGAGRWWPGRTSFPTRQLVRRVRLPWLCWRCRDHLAAQRGEGPSEIRRRPD